MRQIPKLQELIAKGHMKKMTGRGPKNRDIDQALYEWYSQRRAAGERPRSCEVSFFFSDQQNGRLALGTRVIIDKRNCSKTTTFP